MIQFWLIISWKGWPKDFPPVFGGCIPIWHAKWDVGCTPKSHEVLILPGPGRVKIQHWTVDCWFFSFQRARHPHFWDSGNILGEWTSRAPGFWIAVRVYLAVSRVGLVVARPMWSGAPTSLEQCRKSNGRWWLFLRPAPELTRGRKATKRIWGVRFFPCCVSLRLWTLKQRKLVFSVHVAPRVIEWIPFERPLWSEFEFADQSLLVVSTKGTWLKVERQKREDRTQFFQRAAKNLKKFNPLSDDFTEQTLYFLQQRANLSAGSVWSSQCPSQFRALDPLMKPRIRQHPLDVARDRHSPHGRCRRWHSWC